MALRTKSHVRRFENGRALDLFFLDNHCAAARCDKKADNIYRGRHYCRLHAIQIRDRINTDLTDDPIPERSQTVYVYAIAAPEIALFKIGKSRNPKQRYLAQLHQSPVHMDLLGFVFDPTRGALEAWLHAYLRPQQQRGEWFRDTADTRMIVDMITGNRVDEMIAKVRAG